MPDPVRLLATLRKAAQAFRAMPGRRGKVLALQDGKEILVAGDLHGNVENFSRLFKVADLKNHSQRHFVVQEIIHGPFRYADGSDRSHQLLDLLAALACQFPRQVHFLLGNHELSQWTGREIGKADEQCNNIFVAGIHTAYGEHAEAILAAYQELFAAAALVIRTPNRVFLSHSLPRAARLASFEMSLLEKDELTHDDTTVGGAAYSLVWGRDTSEQNVTAFLQKVDADILITGHIPCEEGFDTPNHAQLVLDASGPAPAYCLFSLEQPLSLQELVAGVRVL